MIHKYQEGAIPPMPTPVPDLTLTRIIEKTPAAIDTAMERFDFRQATAALWRIVEEANRHVVEVEPWNLAKAEKNGDPDAGARLSDALALLIHASRTVAAELTPSSPTPPNE